MFKLISVSGMLKRIRKYMEPAEGETPRCDAQFKEPCTNKKCVKNFIHCAECFGRISAWFTPAGEKLWCGLCRTQSDWFSHEEYRKANAHARSSVTSGGTMPSTTAEVERCAVCQEGVSEGRVTPNGYPLKKPLCPECLGRVFAGEN